MSKARLVIVAVVFEGRTQADVARSYGVSPGWVSRLVARYRVEGETAFEPRSRRPRTPPRQTPEAVVAEIVRLRVELATAGHDAGPDTICWHLEHDLGLSVSPATISRHLVRAGLVVPQPEKRPKSSYVRFQAALPNECWQADMTHYRLVAAGGTGGGDAEILSWLDDHARYALRVTAHRRVTGSVVLAEFRRAVANHGPPASTLTDNAMVFTTRLAGGKGGRNAFESELRRLGVRQKNSRPEPPDHLREGRTVPADLEAMAGGTAPPASLDRRTRGAVRPLLRQLQRAPAAPFLGWTVHAGGGLPDSPQSPAGAP